MGKKGVGKVYHCNGWTGGHLRPGASTALGQPVAPDSVSACKQKSPAVNKGQTCGKTTDFGRRIRASGLTMKFSTTEEAS